MAHTKIFVLKDLLVLRSHKTGCNRSSYLNKNSHFSEFDLQGPTTLVTEM